SMLKLATIAGVLSVSACTTVPDSIVTGPKTARPQPASYAPPTSGAIFQSAVYRPLLEDRRARLVGDTITIVINEKTSAVKSAGSSA
ncbi:flagellar basal body L-ring protein FlgH, partial [Acinetobacter baumannii]